MKRSLIALLMALVMVLSVILLASCGGEKVDNGEGGEGKGDIIEAGSTRLDLSQYQIYYALDTGAKTSAALNSLMTLLRSAYGIQVAVDAV